jgi:RNA polymerase sigma factor (sigma-70 family)
VTSLPNPSMRPRTFAAAGAWRLAPHGPAAVRLCVVAASDGPAEPPPPAATEAALRRDRALIERWRAGDTAAGSELLDHYTGYVRRIALRHGIRGGAEFEEFWQEVVLRLLQQLPLLTERLRTSFAGFLAWQVRDLVRNRNRARRRDPVPSATVEPASDAASAPGARSAFWEALQACAAQLPPRELAVFEHRFLGGCDLAEVAARTGSNANAVAQAVFRLVRRLRDCLTAKGFDGPGDFS